MIITNKQQHFKNQNWKRKWQEPESPRAPNTIWGPTRAWAHQRELTLQNRRRSAKKRSQPKVKSTLEEVRKAIKAKSKTERDKLLKSDSSWTALGPCKPGLTGPRPLWSKSSRMSQRIARVILMSEFHSLATETTTTQWGSKFSLSPKMLTK